VPAVLAAWAQANVAQANLDYANAQMTPTVSLEPEVRHYLNDATRDTAHWIAPSIPPGSKCRCRSIRAAG
jgi:outer membrane protein TolC